MIEESDVPGNYQVCHASSQVSLKYRIASWKTHVTVMTTVNHGYWATCTDIYIDIQENKCEEIGE